MGAKVINIWDGRHTQTYVNLWLGWYTFKLEYTWICPYNRHIHQKQKPVWGVQSHGDIDYTAALKKLNQWIRNNTELSARLAATGYIPTQRRSKTKKGEMMFCLADVCKALGIANPSVAKTRLDGGYLCTTEVSTKSKNQYGEFNRTVTLTFIGEPNLYRCIFQSKKEGAKRFQDWVFGD